MIEHSVAFGPNKILIGTLCLPEGEAAGKAAVGQILFNAGIVHRVGPHRINVRLARSLARSGIPSLRFDLAGLGDSARADGKVSFEEQAIVDIRHAMDELGTHTGLSRFSLFGFCSGGCHGYAAAPADERIVGLIMYDTYVYLTMKSRLNRVLVSIRRLGLAKFVSGWLGRQPGHMSRRVRVLLGREREPEPQPTSAGYFRVPSKEEFARRVTMLHARGVKVGVIYSGGYQDYNYHDQFADAFGSFGLDRLVTYDYLPEMGHTATVMAAQTEFMRRIEDWTMDLDRRCRELAPAAPGAAPAPKAASNCDPRPATL